MGREYWQPLVEYLKKTMLEHDTIDANDVTNLFITDSPAEAIQHIYETTYQINNGKQ